MRIEVKVKTKAKENKVKKMADGKYLVTTTAAPENGKANDQVLKMLAREIGAAKSSLRIIRGVKSKEKILEVDN